MFREPADVLFVWTLVRARASRMKRANLGLGITREYIAGINHKVSLRYPGSFHNTVAEE